MPEFVSDSVEYKYFVTDLLSNAVLAEIPFTGVTYERGLKAAGGFDGSISVIRKTKDVTGNEHLDLYNSTMAGKCGLYVVRDGQCVWGGIIWNRSYTASTKELKVSGSEFTSYLHHRYIWKSFLHRFGATIAVSSGTAIVTLDTLTYPFAIGSTVRLIFPTADMFSSDGYYTVATAPTNYSFTISGTSIPNGTYPLSTVYVRADTYDYVRQLVALVMADFDGENFASNDLRPSVSTDYHISSIVIVSNVATVTTDQHHGIIPTQSIDIVNTGTSIDGVYQVTSVTSDTVFTFNITHANATIYTPVVTKTVTTKKIIDFVGFATTSAPHGLVVGQTVEMTGVDGANVSVISKKVVTGVATIKTATAHGASVGDTLRIAGVDSVLNGIRYVDTVESATSLTFTTLSSNIPLTTVSGTVNISTPTAVFDGQNVVVAIVDSYTFCIDVTDTDMNPVMLSGATMTLTPAAKVGSYGPFPGNSDIGIDFSTQEYSGHNVITVDHRGYELVNVGEELDRYADTLIGFEYRIDCDIKYIGGVPTFTRTFVLLSLTFPSAPLPGAVSPISRFGADQLVFDYPGSILDVTFDESAEHAATRFFVTGQDPALGDGAAQPYAAATALDLLKQGWPLLEQQESRNELYNTSMLYYYAQRYLAEARPPVSTFSVQVNGSLEPKIGQYVPGDWCSINVNDSFIQARLHSALEPRDTVLVRKIDSFKVTVPNNPSFPEVVDLSLIREALADPSATQ